MYKYKLVPRPTPLLKPYRRPWLIARQVSLYINILYRKWGQIANTSHIKILYFLTASNKFVYLMNLFNYYYHCVFLWRAPNEFRFTVTYSIMLIVLTHLYGFIIAMAIIYVRPTSLFTDNYYK